MKNYLAISSTIISTALAVSIGHTDFRVEAGKTFMIDWYDATGPCSIVLQYGPSDKPEDLMTIASMLSSSYS